MLPSFWELVLRDCEPQLDEQIKDLLELHDHEPSVEIKSQPPRIPTLFEQCCDVLSAQGVALHKQEYPHELQDDYVRNYQGAFRKRDSDMENVRYHVLFALEIFDMLMFMKHFRLQFRIYSKRQWKSLWGFRATLHFSVTIPYQAVFMDMLWKCLHDQLELPPVQQAIMERHTAYWKYYCLRHIDGQVFTVYPKPYFDGNYPTRPEEIQMGAHTRRTLPRKIVAAIESGQCTFTATGESYRYVQPHWICLTCGLGVENDLFICQTCALTTHKDHKLIYRGLWKGYCDSLD